MHRGPEGLEGFQGAVVIGLLVKGCKAATAPVYQSWTERPAVRDPAASALVYALAEHKRCSHKAAVTGRVGLSLFSAFANPLHLHLRQLRTCSFTRLLLPLPASGPCGKTTWSRPATWTSPPAGTAASTPHTSPAPPLAPPCPRPATCATRSSTPPASPSPPLTRPGATPALFPARGRTARA